MPQKTTYTRAVPEELKLEQGAIGERLPAGIAMQERASVTVNTDQTYQPRPFLEVIFFSKIHWVTPELFVQEAAGYQQMLRRDLLLQQEEVAANRHYYQQWAFPDKTCDAIIAGLVRAGEGTSRAIKNLFNDIKNAPKPDLEDFDELLFRLKLLGADVAMCAADLTYERIHKAGLDLALAREDFKRLMRLVNGFQQRAIGAAETGQATAEAVESASFQILSLVPTITLMDPVREAIYKIGLIVVRGLARSTGALLADSGKAGVIKECYGVLQADVPNLIADLVTGKLSKVLTNAGHVGIGREVIVAIARQIIEFAGSVTVIVLNRGFNFTEDDCHQLFQERVTSIICSFLSMVLGGRPQDPRYQKIGKAAAESILSNLYKDYVAAKETAQAQKREVSDVMLENAPAIIVHIVLGVFTGVATRNAAQMQHQYATEGGKEAADWRTVRSYLDAQPASALYNDEKVGGLPRSMKPFNKVPLRSLGPSELTAMANKHSLPLEVLLRLRRCAHDFEWIVILRTPSRAMAQHFKALWKWPKPIWIKAKSSNFLSLAGLVRKPMIDPATGQPTHAKMADATHFWNQYYGLMLENGGMVREDGLAFHPEMLQHWAAGHKEDAAIAARAFQVLTQMNQKTSGTADFTNPAAQAALKQAAGADHEAVRAFLNRVDIGFYPDLDMTEVINQRTGERIVLGHGSEKGSELNYVQRNRSMLDEVINIHHDNEHVPDEWRGPNGKVRISSEQDTPFRHALVAHGGDAEIDAAHAAGGSVEIIAMNGDVRHAENAQEIEAHLAQLLGPKYKPEEARERDAKRTSLEDPTNWSEANGKGQRIRTAKMAKIKRLGGAAMQDLPAKGDEIQAEDVHASLVHRGLSMAEADLAKVRNFRSAYQVFAVLEAHQTLIGVDLEARNLVLAVAANSGVADGLARLAATYQELDLANSGATVWIELYTSDRPVTADHILGRLGSSQPGLHPLESAHTNVSSLQPPAGKRHYAYAVDGKQNSFSPPVAKNTSKGPVQRSHDTRRKDIRDGFLSNVARYDHTYAHVHGWQLHDVWEETASLKLSATPVKLHNLDVAVFNSALVTAMGFQEMHNVASEHFLQPMAG